MPDGAPETTDLMAEVIAPGGRRFEAGLANLTHNSVFMKTSEKLEFRERVKLSFLGARLSGEVAFISANPRGVVVAFRSSKQDSDLLESLFDDVETLMPDEPWDDETVQGAEDAVADVVAEVAAQQGPTDTLESMAVIKPETDNPFASTTPTPFGMLAGQNSDDPNMALPELTADGTLKFSSATAFAFQYESNLVHGGIVAKSPPLAIGASKVIRLEVPGITDQLQITARVGFIGDGTVGFMIDSFALQKPKLESLLLKLS